MSVVGRAFFVTVVGVLCAFVMPQGALAERVYSSEYTITVSATVLEHRTIVVDANGVIIGVSSNTENTITPEVRFLNNSGPHVPLTFQLSRDYQHLMSQLQTNHVFVMARQTPTINGLMPQLLLPISQHAFLVSPTQVGSRPSSSYFIYE
ncbi:MAG: hypothetical protein ABIS59_00200 [Candidatus Saccharibacteria bacterium]